MEIVVFEGDLKDAADTLLMDQFAMFKIVPAKNGGFFAKDIIFQTYQNTPQIAQKLKLMLYFYPIYM